MQKKEKVYLQQLKDVAPKGKILSKSAQKSIRGGNGLGDCGSATISKWTSNGNGGQTADECDAIASE